MVRQVVLVRYTDTQLNLQFEISESNRVRPANTEYQSVNVHGSPAHSDGISPSHEIMQMNAAIATSPIGLYEQDRRCAVIEYLYKSMLETITGRHSSTLCVELAPVWNEHHLLMNLTQGICLAR